MRVIDLFKRATIGLVFLCALGLWSASSAVDPGFPPSTGDRSILPPGATLDRIFDGGCVLTEGVAAGHDGMIYFSDITFTRACKDPSGKFPQAGHIWRYNPKTGEAAIFRSPSGMSNGLKFDREGNMIAALGADFGGRMLIKTDMKTGKSYILTGLFEGKPYNALNDISIDEKGRIYFTDPRYLGHEPVMADGFAAYRLDPDGTVRPIAASATASSSPRIRRGSTSSATIMAGSSFRTSRRARSCFREVTCSRSTTWRRTARSATGACSKTTVGTGRPPAAGRTASWPTWRATSTRPSAVSIAPVSSCMPRTGASSRSSRPGPSSRPTSASGARPRHRSST